MNIITIFKKFIEFILKLLFDKDKNETNFITFNGDELITLNDKLFLVREVK